MAKLGEPSSLRKNIPELSNAVNREKGTNQKHVFHSQWREPFRPSEQLYHLQGANEQNRVEVQDQQQGRYDYRLRDIDACHLDLSV